MKSSTIVLCLALCVTMAFGQFCSSGCGPGRCVAPNQCNCTGTGWQGPTCNIPLCDPACTRGGVCVGPGQCDCSRTNYTGVICEVPLCNKVDPLGCRGGRCVSPEVCDCNGTGYTGQYCTIPTCENGCANGGRCVGPNMCDCTGTNRAGPTCNDFPCDPICLNGGVCNETLGCECPEGWTGESCDEAVCEEPCQNGGTCSAPDTCDCEGTGFTGDLCEVELDECSKTPYPCDVLVSCTNTNGGFVCGPCPAGLIGSGSLLSGGCKCPEGFERTNATDVKAVLCEDVNECELLRPCSNVSNCTNLPGNFKCSPCPIGYEGDGFNCTSSLLTCLPECENGGQCMDDNICDCTGTGFGGFRCELPEEGEESSSAFCVAVAAEVVIGAAAVLFA